MTEEQVRELIERHGGLVNVEIVDPQIEETITLPDGSTIVVGTAPNPTPRYRYLLADGTHFTARANGDGTHSITDWGTAGAVERQRQREEREQAEPIVREVDGELYERQPDGQWVKVVERPRDATPVVREVGGSLYQWDPSTQQWRLVIAKNASATVRTPEEIEADRLALQTERLKQQQMQLGMETERLRQEQLRQQLLGQQAVVQNHFQLVRDLEQRLARGEITVEEANRFLEQSQRLTEAALRGATPFQIEQQQEAVRQARAELGRSILNQRLQTGASLAQALLSSALGAAEGILGRPDRPITFDPLQAAIAFTQQLGGGQEVGDLARSLLLGALASQTEAAEPTALTLPPPPPPPPAPTPTTPGAQGVGASSAPVTVPTPQPSVAPEPTPVGGRLGTMLALASLLPRR
jgi:hypothetical protein